LPSPKKEEPKRKKDDSLKSLDLIELMPLIKNGDVEAKNRLIKLAGNRLTRLARKMLQQFPGVRRLEETGDICQSCAVRLCNSLERMEITSTREFFNVAATLMRRELIDLSRHYYGPHGDGKNVVYSPNLADNPEDRPSEGENWADFHVAVESLPQPQRELFSLVFYHGWSKTEAAALFQVDKRTISRWWRSALGMLHRRFHEPDLKQETV
jgi:RNA polymerase sigma-70 factor (ECF subfamily)